MEMAAIGTITMRQSHQLRTYQDSKEYRENWTTGGLIVAFLIVPAFVALMAAPGIVTGMVLGVVALKVGERMVRQLRRHPGSVGLSAPGEQARQSSPVE